MYSRRDLGKLALASLPISAMAAKINSVAGGVRLGCITYGFRDLPRVEGATDQVDAWIKAIAEIGYGEIELMNNVVEPLRANPIAGGGARGPAAPGRQRGGAAGARGEGAPPARRGPSPEQQKAREELRQWRLSTPMSHFTTVKKKFNAAGITLFAYTANGMGDDFTGPELDKIFEQAKALGVTCVSSSTQLTVAKKLAPFAERHKFRVAFHGHANVKDPNEFATPESYEKAFEMSKYFVANVDVGHMTAANYDPIPFIQKHAARIQFIHIKDRKKDQGQNQPWGQGDTPIKEVLQLVKKNKYKIPCYQELEYRVPDGSTSVAESRKCLEFMRKALA